MRRPDLTPHHPEICSAIANRRVLHLRYGGGDRTVEPYTHGFTRWGEEVMSAYQTGGHSSSGEVRGWKTFRLDRVDGLAVSVNRFSGKRDDYDPDDLRFTYLHCRVEP